MGSGISQNNSLETPHQNDPPPEKPPQDEQPLEEPSQKNHHYKKRMRTEKGFVDVGFDDENLDELVHKLIIGYNTP